MSDLIDTTNIMANKEAYFTPPQVDKIIRACWANEKYRHAMLFHTLFLTGRRISEILGRPPYSPDKKRAMGSYKGLRPIDIKWQNKVIEYDILKKQHVKKMMRTGVKRRPDVIAKLKFHKKPKRVLIAAPDELLYWLAWYIKAYQIQPYDRLFTIGRNRARDWLLWACEEAGLKMNLGTKRYKNPRTGEIEIVRTKPHLHMFRHACAIRTLQEHPKDPRALPFLKTILQHSNLNITEAYLQFSQEDLRKFLNNPER